MYHAINLKSIPEDEAQDTIRQSLKDNPNRAMATVGDYKVMFDKFGERGHLARLFKGKDMVALAIVEAADTPASDLT